MFTASLPLRFAAAIALAGCVAPSELPPTDPSNPWPHTAGAGGFDPVDADAVWSDGDFVRYWIESDADGARRAWTFEIALPEVPKRFRGGLADSRSGFRRTPFGVWQSLTDKATGTKFLRYSDSPVDVRVRLEQHGSGETFATTVSTQVQGHMCQDRVDTHANFGIQFMFRVLLKVDQLLDELLSVVKPPSIASVLGNGMRVDVALALHRPVHLEVFEVDTPLGRVPAFWLPATLFANDQKALDCRFLITWRRSPLLLTVGILRIEGHHPDDPGKRLSAHLIAARRGVAHQAPDRGNLGGPGLRVGMSEAELLAAVSGKLLRRYRLQRSDGYVVELLSVQISGPYGHRVGAFSDGKLLYFNSGGGVGSYVAHRGFPAAPFTKENLVWSAEPRK